MIKEAVVTVVEFENGVLIVKKVDDGKSLMSNKWHLPGETKLGNETDEETVKRGIFEEAGIIVTGIIYLTSSTTPKKNLFKLV